MLVTPETEYSLTGGGYKCAVGSKHLARMKEVVPFVSSAEPVQQLRRRRHCFRQRTLYTRRSLLTREFLLVADFNGLASSSRTGRHDLSM